MIVLGDQFPIGGGLLRRQALIQAMEKWSFPKEEIRYDWHDVDAPWRQEGYKEARVIRKWTDYWSLGLRHPMSFRTPEVVLEQVRATLGSPNGLSYLIGPKTDTTLRAEDKNEKVLNGVKEMVKEDVLWMSEAAKITGKNIKERERKEREMMEIVKKSRTLTELFRLAGEICVGFRELKSTLEIYQSEPIKKIFLPNDYFWLISGNDFQRQKLNRQTTNNSLIIIPKGIALFLDFAIRGFTTGFTGCGYLDETRELRDRYLSEIKMKFLKITFDWTFPENPIDILLAEFRERKRKRGKETAEIAEEDVRAIKDFWRTRPTELGYFFLGGELNPKIEEIIL